jgi:hypothetical protein
VNRSGRKLEAVRVRGERRRKDRLSTSSWGRGEGVAGDLQVSVETRLRKRLPRIARGGGGDSGRSNGGMSWHGHGHARRQLLTLRSPVKAAAEGERQGELDV